MLEQSLKIFALTMCIVLLCGCSVEYNIEIDEKNIKENIIVNEKVVEERQEVDIMDFYGNNYPVYIDQENDLGISYNLKEKYDNVSYYDKSFKIDNYGYHLNYNYTHDINKYYLDYLVVKSYDQRQISIENNILTFNQKSINNYMKYLELLDSIKINIKTEYTVLENNADSIENNVYTWNIDKKNNSTKRIKLKIDLNKKNEIVEKNEEEKTKNKNHLLYVLGIIFAYLGVMLYVIKNK